VGTKTAAHDNPNLTVRNWSGRNPVRLVIDRFLRLSDHLNLFDKSVATVCFNVLKHEEFPNLKLVRLDEENFISELLAWLHKEKIQSVMVEGGSKTLSFFIDSGSWDEARIFTSSRSFHKGIKAPGHQGDLILSEQISTDFLQVFHRHQVG
jgi:diaminohydroxyphosphoribosylaminopyrimidine deaminase/5-amino-6-(5-phosphoribosylamino)uracil reductase